MYITLFQSVFILRLRSKTKLSSLKKNNISMLLFQ